MPFVKGQSGNPKGCPDKEWTWGSLFKEMMAEYADDPKLGKKAIAKAMVKKAFEGDIQAFKEMANRMDGMPKQAVDVTSDGKALQPSVEQQAAANALINSYLGKDKS